MMGMRSRARTRRKPIFKTKTTSSTWPITVRYVWIWSKGQLLFVALRAGRASTKMNNFFPPSWRSKVLPVFMRLLKNLGKIFTKRIVKPKIGSIDMIKTFSYNKASNGKINSRFREANTNCQWDRSDKIESLAFEDCLHLLNVLYAFK